MKSVFIRATLAAAAVLMAWSITGCATMVKARHVEPAKFPVAGIRKLVVEEFDAVDFGDDRWAEAMSSAVRRALEGEDFYEVVGRESEGVDGILTGMVKEARVTRSITHRKVTEEIHTGRYRDGQEIIRERTRLIPIVRKYARLEVEVALRDARTGEQVAGEEYKESKSTYQQGDIYLRDVYDADDLMERLVSRIAEKVVRDLVPQPAWESVRLMPCKGCGSGERLAREGRWSEARQAWEAAVAADPENHAAWYNLGVAAEVSKDYTEAINKYNRAVSIDDKKTYRKALERAERRQKEQQVLDRQLKGR